MLCRGIGNLGLSLAHAAPRLRLGASVDESSPRSHARKVNKTSSLRWLRSGVPLGHAFSIRCGCQGRTGRFPQPIHLFAEWRRVVEWERLKARPGSRVHRVCGTGYSDRKDVSAPINTFVTHT